MRDILLINPNSSTATTAMMVRLASLAAPPGWRIHGTTAGDGPAMIIEQAELERSAVEVERSWLAHARAGAKPAEGVIVGAFGDPGIGRLRAVCGLPVVGLCESSMQEAATGGRRFGVATVTPGLAGAIDGLAVLHGFASLYTGIRLTSGEPRTLAADPQALEDALAGAVARCIEDDGTEAVIIGGGPLGQAAAALGPRFAVPVIAPIAAAVRRLSALLGGA